MDGYFMLKAEHREAWRHETVQEKEGSGHQSTSVTSLPVDAICHIPYQHPLPICTTIPDQGTVFFHMDPPGDF